jgi:hypothetical protein
VHRQRSGVQLTEERMTIDGAPNSLCAASYLNTKSFSHCVALAKNPDQEKG